MVNIGFNDKNGMFGGNLDTRYPVDYAKRNNMENTIGPTMRITGIYGYIRLANNELRSLGLVIANGIDD